MIESLKTWWQIRTPREQRMLLVMIALLALVVAWLGIVRPLDSALADARSRHARAVLAVAGARTQAVAIARLERTDARSLGAPLQPFIGAAAAEAGFTAARIEADGGDEVRVAIDAARPAALFAWAAMLERRYGLVVTELSARANSDATLAVELRVRERGR